ncbi:hypothetical protein [Methylotenera sp. 1P/1]|uniref:hypothetical protein n=1 Tax=Methylotenera sp. 1P/1 TaxID=1131551 RepID=UPI0003629013|nr:hypothetical protein [Methylotenera sp. 1P/1]
MKNNKLVLLARFATQARRFIGAVNVTKMSTDESYALQTILNAKVSDNAELKELAKKISQSLILNQKLLEAIDHFLAGYIAVDELPKVEYFIQRFATHIYKITPESGDYRHAVSEFLAEVDEHCHPFCTQMIRLFYPYWAAEFAYQGSAQYLNLSSDLTSLTSSPKSLLDLWEEAESSLLSTTEQSLLNYFMTDMLNKEISQDAVDARQKIAKILTVELRNNQAETHSDYRKTVDKIRAIINKHDLKTLFLEVSRDFYSYWSRSIQQHQHLK